MPDLQLRWSLDDGYARILEGARIEARLGAADATLLAKVSPAGLARRNRPIDLSFRLSHTYRATLPGPLRLRLAPGSRLEARLLFAGNAFLGNFRVPARYFAVQWLVEGLVQAGGALGGFAVVGADSRLTQTWVTEFEHSDLSPLEALQEGWRSHLNLLRAADAARISDGQVHRLIWDGQLRAGIEISWSLVRGWTVPGELSPLSLSAGLSLKGNAAAAFSFRRSGRFQLQVSRRRGKASASLRQIRERTVGASVSATGGAGSMARLVGLKSQRPALDEHLLAPLSRPAIRLVNRQLSRALMRRLEVSLAVTLSGKRARTFLLRGDWSRFDRSSFAAFVASLLRGHFPANHPNVRTGGSLETVRQRELRVSLSLFDWIFLEKRRSRRSEDVVTLTPDGHLLLEKAVSLSWLKRTRRNRQMASVVLRELEEGEGKAPFRWSLVEEGRFDAERFRKWARIALHAGIVGEVRIPPRSRFPLQARCVLISEFSRAGLASIREVSEKEALHTLIRIMEIEAPERYGVPGFWRDWMDHPEVREAVARDPVQSYLVSRYPVPGRTEAQRRHVVFDYLRARRFLDLLAAWRSRDVAGVLKLLEDVSNLHAFLYFNRACPAGLKRTAGTVQGDLEQVWGEGSLLLE